MKIAIVIITVDRVLGRNYLSNTLESLRSSGACDDSRFSIDVYHSGSNRANLDLNLIRLCNATLHTNDTKTHTNESSRIALNIGVTREPDYVLFMEDDVEVCSEFPEFVCSQLDLNPTAPIVDFISYYDEVRDSYFSGERFVNINAQLFYGAQCFALPVQSANSLSLYIDSNINKKIGYIDTWIGDWLGHIGENEIVANSVPCAAQHVGRQSVLTHEFISTNAFKNDLENARFECLNHYSMRNISENEFVLSHNGSLAQIELNAMAQVIYLACLNGSSILEIENEIVENTGFDRFEVNQQIRQCTAFLVERGALRYCN